MNDSFSLRQIALKLHAMHASDRAWILARLPDDQKNSLTLLIKELDHLGFAPEIVVETPLIALPCGNLDIPEYAVEKLESASPGELSRMIAVMPRRLVAMLLFAKNWPWSGQIVDAMDVRERNSLMEHMKSMSAVRPRVIVALVEACVDTLQQP